MDETDWLRREEQAAWYSRIRQLRRELMEERTKHQILQSAPQEVVQCHLPAGTSRKTIRTY